MLKDYPAKGTGYMTKSRFDAVIVDVTVIRNFSTGWKKCAWRQRSLSIEALENRNELQSNRNPSLLYDLGCERPWKTVFDSECVCSSCCEFFFLISIQLHGQESTHRRRSQAGKRCTCTWRALPRRANGNGTVSHVYVARPLATCTIEKNSDKNVMQLRMHSCGHFPGNSQASTWPLFLSQHAASTYSSYSSVRYVLINLEERTRVKSELIVIQLWD